MNEFSALLTSSVLDKHKLIRQNHLHSLQYYYRQENIEYSFFRLNNETNQLNCSFFHTGRTGRNSFFHPHVNTYNYICYHKLFLVLYRFSLVNNEMLPLCSLRIPSHLHKDLLMLEIFLLHENNRDFHHKLFHYV
ncbi:hypothetical protein CI610_03647 [invertebrate metagenome]|uniref:Uncharacterized protein n=1 Tax=invertebrate metagenome TaxID=1711999 RepID=A0A2H9T2I7_9ZZZZ